MGKRGGFRKISDDEDKASPCQSPEHDPPRHIVLAPGTYEYECPSCGRTITIKVPSIR